MKKLLSILLSIVMILSITAGMNLTAFAAGNSKVEATEIQLGQTVNSAITETNDVDWYKFTIPSSGKITVNFVYQMRQFDYKIYEGNSEKPLYENNVAIYSENATVDSTEKSFFSIGDTYYIKVEWYYNQGNPYFGDYSLTVSLDSNESFPENTTKNDDSVLSANKIEINQKYNGCISSKNDIDYYKFNLSQKTTLNLIVNYSQMLYCSVINKNRKSVVDYYSCTGFIGDMLNGCFMLYADDNSGLVRTNSYTFELPKGEYCLVFQSDTVQNYGFTLSAPKKPAKAKLNKLTASKGGKIKATWSKAKGASGYQIAYSKSKSFKKTIATKTVSGSKKTSYTGKNFTKGKKYYVRVRAYKNYNGKKVYGSWSNVKSVKAK